MVEAELEARKKPSEETGPKFIGEGLVIDEWDMAITRITARKSVTPVLVRETIPSEVFQPRTRAQAAIRMKQLAIDNQSRTIRRLRASAAERRREMEDLKTLLTAADKRNNEVFHLYEIARGDNFELRETIEISVGQASRANEEIERRNQELAEAKQAHMGDKKRLEEAWIVIRQLSENNQRLTKEVDKGKIKKKALVEKNKADYLHARNVLDEAVAKIITHIDEITALKQENQNLQLQIEDLVNPEDPEEDPEEEEEAPPIEAVGDGEID